MSLSPKELDQLCINTLRCLAMDAVEQAKAGHPGMPMGAAAMTYAVWSRFLRHNPRNPEWFNRDRFILSPGHGCTLLYALLHLTGYELTLDDLKSFRQWGSKCPGHSEYGHPPGVEVTTGPLGQGFATGVGLAAAQKHLAAIFNRPGHEVVNYKIYAVVSDGDLMEGLSSEAASLAGHLKLGNLVYLYDDNHISIEGDTELAFTEDTAKRFEAFGWQVSAVEDGNDTAAVARAVEAAAAETERPSLIKIRTHIAWGAPHAQDTAAAHGAPLGEEEIRLTKQNYGWDPDRKFYVPEAAAAHFRTALEKGAAAEADWNKKLSAYEKKHPELAARFKDFLAGKLPAGWREVLPKFAPGKGAATRKHSGAVLNALAEKIPQIIGGSADLSPSTNTIIKSSKDFQAGSYAGRNLHFGVREHAMGAFVNGLALSRLIPYTATFTVFSDYMRPAIRLAALMKVGSIFVFTHDSIGLGEDGPTHQPVEHLTSLRCIPDLVTIRPADGAETAVAWRTAIERRDGPTILFFTRQTVPELDRGKYASAENLVRGGYVLYGKEDETPQVLLMTAGSETHLTLAAAELLEKDGVKVRVAAMPSPELFDRQPREYRERVLPPKVRARVAVEAVQSSCWGKYVGLDGAYVCIDRFGASAKFAKLLKEYGFTPENIAAKARELL